MIETDLHIESRHNAHFRQLVQLVESSRERRRSERNVIEGVHLLDAFWTASQDRKACSAVGTDDAPATRLHDIYVPTPLDRDEVAALVRRIVVAAQAWPHDARPRVIGLKESLFRQVSQVRNGGGPLAVIDTPRPLLPAMLTGDALYLDRVQDPANVGAMLRTAAAAGIGDVLLSPTAAFCWAPKVLRAAMGAHFALRIHEGVEWSALTDERLAGLCVRALVAPTQHDASRGQDLHDADLRAPTLWVCGQEGQGVAAGLLADSRVTGLSIAQHAGVESLNVAAATAVALFEQRRQRRQPD